MDGLPFPSTGAVRGLLRALVAGPAGEDAFQQAWLEAALKRVPPEELGHWLLGAAKRLTRSRRRDEARRLEREQRAARGEAGPSTLDTLAQLELVRRVTTAVETLEEPYRTAVVLRYFEGLPPRRIARRLDVPVNTARSRVRRGIEELRTRLDPAALLALVPPTMLTELAPSTAPWAALHRTARLAGGVGLVAAGGLYLASRGPAGEGSAALETPQGFETVAVAVPGSAPATQVAEIPAASPADELALPPRAPLAGTSTDARSGTHAPLSASSLAEITGQFLAANGSALVGAQLTLGVTYMSGPLLERAAAATGASPLDSWRDLATVTDAEGRFRLAFEPAPGIGPGLRLSYPAGTVSEWSWLSVAPGERIDLGPVRLGPGATLEGHVVDGEGHPRVDEDWLVSGLAFREVSPTHHLETTVEAEYDSRRAAFVLRGLPAGPLDLRLAAPSSGLLVDLALELEDGEHRVQDLAYAGPDPARCLRLTAVVRGYAGLRLALEDVRLTAAGAAPRAPEPVANSLASFVFTGLGPEDHTLTIDDPRFEPWSRSDLRAGASVRVELTGSAALRLSVVARETGAPLERFAVFLEPRAPLPVHGLRFHDGATQLDGGRLPGLLPGSYLVRVGAPGFAEGEAEVLELAPGETRALNLALEPAPTLAGHVRHADGRPAAGVVVACLLPLASADPQRPPSARPELARGECNDLGAFRLELARAGACDLVVLDPSTGAPLSACVPALADGGVEGLELVVP